MWNISCRRSKVRQATKKAQVRSSDFSDAVESDRDAAIPISHVLRKLEVESSTLAQEKDSGSKCHRRVRKLNVKAYIDGD